MHEELVYDCTVSSLIIHPDALTPIFKFTILIMLFCLKLVSIIISYTEELSFKISMFYIYFAA